MFNSICLIFTSLNLSLNASINITHSLVYSSAVEGFLPNQSGKCAALFCQCCTFHSFNLASNDWTFESRELRSWFWPCSLIFNSDRYLVMSTINAKSHSHLLSLSSLTSFPFISMNCLTSSRSSQNLLSTFP